MKTPEEIMDLVTGRTKNQVGIKYDELVLRAIEIAQVDAHNNKLNLSKESIDEIINTKNNFGCITHKSDDKKIFPVTSFIFDKNVNYNTLVGYGEEPIESLSNLKNVVLEKLKRLELYLDIINQDIEKVNK